MTEENSPATVFDEKRLDELVNMTSEKMDEVSETVSRVFIEMFGEMPENFMEKFSPLMLAHGASNFLRDRLLFNSDFYRVHVCDLCGMIAQSDLETQRFLCKCKKSPYNRTKISQVMMPYAFKLLLQEMASMAIATHLILDE